MTNSQTQAYYGNQFLSKSTYCPERHLIQSLNAENLAIGGIN